MNDDEEYIEDMRIFIDLQNIQRFGNLCVKKVRVDIFIIVIIEQTIRSTPTNDNNSNITLIAVNEKRIQRIHTVINSYILS